MIAIINSGIGNIRSAANAFEHIGADVKITTDPQDLIDADKIVFPGVGAFCDGMTAIANTGLIQTLKMQIVEKKKPYLGICLGMQLLASKGHEDGTYDGLGIIEGEVSLLPSKDVKLPHIGWNNVIAEKEAILFKELEDDPTFYFVHSYGLTPKDPSIIAAQCDYGSLFCASIQKDNIFGVQFHPEKSQKNGLQLLKNFVNIA